MAEAYLVLRDIDKAIFNWERAASLTPGSRAFTRSWRRPHERINDRKRSLRQFLILAYYFRRDNDNERAIRAVERALKIDPRNSFALNGMNALRAGGELVMPPEDADAAPHTIRHSAPRLDADFEMSDESDKALSEGDPRGPIGESLNQALSMLAAHVLETGMLDATGADALKGDGASAAGRAQRRLTRICGRCRI
ncbi:MAG: hypothetical protein HND48_24420 [Chloroflexi bacterium]|nr:hypothetical protein [Chloroflexota bacterium]